MYSFLSLYIHYPSNDPVNLFCSNTFYITDNFSLSYPNRCLSCIGDELIVCYSKVPFILCLWTNIKEIHVCWDKHTPLFSHVVMYIETNTQLKLIILKARVIYTQKIINISNWQVKMMIEVQEPQRISGIYSINGKFLLLCT